MPEETPFTPAVPFVHLRAHTEFAVVDGTLRVDDWGKAGPRGGQVPMAMTVEVTDLPSSMRATGVRLLYDAFYPLPTGLRLGGRLGYAARDQIIGGLSAGVNASYDF